MNKDLISRKEVGKRIKDIRVRHSLNLEQFANEIGTGKSNVSKWERGKNLPNDLTLKKIADFDNISVTELVLGSLRDFIDNLILDAFSYATKPFDEATNDLDKLYIEVGQLIIFSLASQSVDEFPILHQDDLFSKLSKEEQFNLTEKKQKSQDEWFDYIATQTEYECLSKDIDYSNEVLVLECIKNTITNYINKSVFDTKKLIEYVLFSLDKIYTDTMDYVFVLDGSTVKDGIDEDTAKKIFSILLEAMKEVKKIAD